MSMSELPVLNVSELFLTDGPGAKHEVKPTRRRSNSQSQVVAPPPFIQPRSSGQASSRNLLYLANRDHKPPRRQQAEYYVTLLPLNDTFVKKHIHVPYFPDTCRLGRPTGTKIKPHVTNGYFDSRVLSRNHACMSIDPKSGQLMIQDMGSSNGTFVNSNKIGADPVAVKVGDTINLGFNIQLETSHKQISAKIENISVVSNNPKGSVLSGLPMLTKDVINGFNASELHHLDFIQSVFNLVLPSKEEPEDTENDATTQAQKAFENAMFADVVPSLDDSLAASSETYVTAGIFNNSRIVNSNDLESTLELLMVNLVRVKQQTSTLKSLENFLVNYSSKVDSINANHVKSEVAKCEAKFENSLKAEQDKSRKLMQEVEHKNAEHRSLVGVLENEIIKLRTDHDEVLKRRRSLDENPEITSDNEPNFSNSNSKPTTIDTASYDNYSKENRCHSADISSFDFGTSKSLKEISPEASEEIEEISNSSDLESEEQGEREEGIDVTKENPGDVTAYFNRISDKFYHYKNQGVMLGFFVVVVGYIYQSSSGK